MLIKKHAQTNVAWYVNNLEYTAIYLSLNSVRWRRKLLVGVAAALQANDIECSESIAKKKPAG